jgi:hypothetical protein
MRQHTHNNAVYFRVLSDPAFRDLWFPGNPRVADGTTIDPHRLADAEISHEIRQGKKVALRLVTAEGMRYGLTVHPDGICEIDAREFTEGRPYGGPTPAAVSLDVDGARPEFTFAAFDMPIVSRRLAELIERLCPGQTQRLPVTILPSLSGYEILNVTATADCVDETRSRYIKKWTLDSACPDRVGTFSEIGGLMIDPRRANNHGIFRVRDWEIALIVSDPVKTAMEAIEDLGVVFEPVTE